MVKTFHQVPTVHQYSTVFITKKCQRSILFFMAEQHYDAYNMSGTDNI